MEKEFYINKISKPTGLKKDEYDVIIIGAGIGGLVCGCYLAKAGLKVLILEKNDRPGGYCTYFQKKGVKFDIGIHMLTGCRERGPLGIVLDELNLRQQLSLFRPEVFEYIINRDKSIKIFSDIEKTKTHLIENFPEEKEKIINFLDFLMDFDLKKNCKLKGTFLDFCDEFNFSLSLKNIFGILLTTLTLPISSLSALAGLCVLKEYLTDGGYYPKEGIFNLSLSLYHRFLSGGGEICFLNKVSQIKIKKGIKIVFSSDGKFFSKNIVFACDFFQAINFLSSHLINKDYFKILKRFNLSLSGFSLILFLKKPLDFPSTLGLWYFPVKDVNLFLKKLNKKPYYKNNCFFCIPHYSSPKIITLFSAVPFMSSSYWQKNKNKFKHSLVKSANSFFCNLSYNFTDEVVFSPLDYYRFFLNTKGAIRGWAPFYIQLKDKQMIENIFKKSGFYFVGHWWMSSLPILEGGISFSALNGKIIAEKIIRKN